MQACGRFKFAFLIVLLILPLLAKADSWLSLVPPQDLGKSESQTFDPKFFRLIVWNAEGMDQPFNCDNRFHPRFRNFADFCDSLANADFTMIQEANDKGIEASFKGVGLADRFLTKVPYGERSSHLWGAQAEEFEEIPGKEQVSRGLTVRHSSGDGLMLASKTRPTSAEFDILRNGDSLEIFTHIHILVATKYQVPGSKEELLLINFHNNVSVFHGEQRPLLELAEARIAAHTGPVIFAGDFNSWTENKTNLITELATRNQLVRIPFKSPYYVGALMGYRSLDHIFVRGLHWHKVTVFKDPEEALSDHNAIAVELSIH